MSNISDTLKRWYVGTFTPRENDPRSGLVFTGGDYRRHWTAVAVGAIGRFLAREWKWILTPVIALAATILARRLWK
jgi:hypothetical protein